MFPIDTVFFGKVAVLVKEILKRWEINHIKALKLSGFAFFSCGDELKLVEMWIVKKFDFRNQISQKHFEIKILRFV